MWVLAMEPKSSARVVNVLFNPIFSQMNEIGFYFELGSHHLIVDCLEFAIQTGLAPNSH